MKEYTPITPAQQPIETTIGLLSSKELCKYLNMSWSTVQKYFFHLDNFPKKKVGNKWYFQQHQVDKFLNQYFEDSTTNKCS